MALGRKRTREDTIGAFGDMEYLAASGLWVPVGGVKATGKVPTLQADGTVAWQAGGGSSYEWVTYHPDTPPVAPTTFGGVVYDLEFVRDNTLTTGTDIGSPAVAPTLSDRALKITAGNIGTADIKGREWACPGSAFTMTAKLRRNISVSTLHSFGIMLRRNASGAGNIISINAEVFTRFTDTYFMLRKYTAVTTSSSTAAQGSFAGAIWVPYYLQWVYDGTNIISKRSFTGFPDSFQQVTSEAATTFLGGAPGRFGIVIDNLGTGGANVGFCEWVRFT